MRTRSSRRLAGCIVIELLLGFLGAAADFDYRAAAAAFGQARVLLLEDRHHHRAVIVNVAFSTPLSVSDRIGALAAKAHGLDRSALVIHSTLEAEPAPQDAVTAISGAFPALEPARVSYANGMLAVNTAAGCTMVSVEAVIEECTTIAGEPVRGPIRSAFRIVDLARGLQVRVAAPHYATVQAIALGEAVVIVSAPANLVDPAPNRIVAALPQIDPDSRVAADLADVLRRVRRPH